MPIKLATIALRISAGINNSDNVTDFVIGKLVIKPIIIVPVISNSKTPNTIVVINSTTKLIFLKYKSLTKPIRYVTTGYINKNPADGPANTPIPPLPPDSKGNPAATSNNKTMTLNVPYLRPSKIAAKNIPIFCNTIGTGMTGRGIAGTKPRTAIIAVIKAVYTKYFVVKVIPPSMRKIIPQMLTDKNY